MLFEFNEEKNILLKKTRGVSFEDVIEIINNQGPVDDISHTKVIYSHQRIFIVEIKGYTYSVPYILKGRNVAFLKTLYPSRKFKKQYKKNYENKK
jgi:uncharacterized DUF497 family protein